MDLMQGLTAIVAVLGFLAISAMFARVRVRSLRAADEQIKLMEANRDATARLEELRHRELDILERIAAALESRAKRSTESGPWAQS